MLPGPNRSLRIVPAGSLAGKKSTALDPAEGPTREAPASAASSFVVPRITRTCSTCPDDPLLLRFGWNLYGTFFLLLRGLLIIVKQTPCLVRWGRSKKASTPNPCRGACRSILNVSASAEAQGSPVPPRRSQTATAPNVRRQERGWELAQLSESALV